jgi:hypothetical protein
MVRRYGADYLAVDFFWLIAARAETRLDVYDNKPATSSC